MEKIVRLFKTLKEALSTIDPYWFQHVADLAQGRQPDGIDGVAFYEADDNGHSAIKPVGPFSDAVPTVADLPGTEDCGCGEPMKLIGYLSAQVAVDGQKCWDADPAAYDRDWAEIQRDNPHPAPQPDPLGAMLQGILSGADN